MEPGIFVCYRRGDSAGHAGRIVDALERRFGKRRVFIDVATVEPGVDFVAAIEGALSDCGVFLAVIGRDWLDGKDAEGNRRLDDSQDFIRRELSFAIHREVRVVPVLVQGASMPSAAELPDDLAPLARIQALKLSDERWEFDVGRLIEAIKGRRHRTGPAAKALMAVTGLLVLLVASWLAWPLVSGKEVSGPEVEAAASAPSANVEDEPSAEPQAQPSPSVGAAPGNHPADNAPSEASAEQPTQQDGAGEPAASAAGADEPAASAAGAESRPSDQPATDRTPARPEPPASAEPSVQTAPPPPAEPPGCYLRQGARKGWMVFESNTRQVGGGVSQTPCAPIVSEQTCLRQDFPADHSLRPVDLVDCTPGLYARAAIAAGADLDYEDLIVNYPLPDELPIEWVVDLCAKGTLGPGQPIGDAELDWCEVTP